MADNHGYAWAMSHARTDRNGKPDMRDVFSISDAHADANSRIGKLAREMNADGVRGVVPGRMGGSMGRRGARMGRRGRMGACDTPVGSTATVRQTNGLIRQEIERGRPGMPRVPGQQDPLNQIPYYPVDPGCQFPEFCSGDLLGGNTINNAAFPLAVDAGDVVTESNTVEVRSETADAYRGRYFFWEGRDVNQGYGAQVSLLTQAKIGHAEQLVATGPDFGITSAVFALTNAPLPIGWDEWTNVGAPLQLRFGGFVPDGALQFLFVFWGDAAYQ